MSFVTKAKFKIPNELKTRTKVLTIALEIGCKDEVTNLMMRYDKLYFRYRNSPISSERLAENFLQELANIDIRLVSWLFDDAGEIRVNNKVIMKMVDDGT